MFVYYFGKYEYWHVGKMERYDTTDHQDLYCSGVIFVDFHHPQQEKILPCEIKHEHLASFTRKIK